MPTHPRELHLVAPFAEHGDSSSVAITEFLDDSLTLSVSAEYGWRFVGIGAFTKKPCLVAEAVLFQNGQPILERACRRLPYIPDPKAAFVDLNELNFSIGSWEVKFRLDHGVDGQTNGLILPNPQALWINGDE